MNLKAAVILSVLCIPTVILADQECIYEIGHPCIRCLAETKNGFLPIEHREIGKFVLGVDSFSEIEKLFGTTQMWHSGDAGTSEDKVCFISDDGTTQILIVFAMYRPMSNGIVDSVRLIKGDSGFSGMCNKTKIPPSQFKTKSGISLGMKIGDFINLMGEPTVNSDGLLCYSYCETKPYDPDDDWCVYNGESKASRCSGITARFVDGQLKWIEIKAKSMYSC